MIFIKPQLLKLFIWLFPEVIPYIKLLGYQEGQADFMEKYDYILGTHFENGYKLAKKRYNTSELNYRTGFNEGYASAKKFYREVSWEEVNDSN